jgi:hypothetical protein
MPGPNGEPDVTPDGSEDLAALELAADAAAAAAEAPILEAIAQASDTVRNSAEFKALEKAARKTAREAGRVARDAYISRNQAESDRQAAEALSRATQEDQIRTLLGDDGVVAWNEIADLSDTDPVAAAKRLQEFGLEMAKSLAAADPTGAATPPEGGTVPSTPPLPGGSVDPNAPLNPPATDEVDQLIAQLDKKYTDVVDRNQDPITRNRVTMRDRSDAFIAFLGSAVVQAKRDVLGRPRN